MPDIELDQVMQSVVKIDTYEDDRPKTFESYCEGDMDSDTHTDDVVIKLSDLPPGAKVTVEYPCCPDCGDKRGDVYEHSDDGSMKVIGHESKCSCGFNWTLWENIEFS